jgi:C-terminal processing protease CtpA/Prc
MSEAARAYLDEVVGRMQASSMNRLIIDWNVFRTTVDGAAANAQTPANTYAAIAVAVRMLGDGHSSFQNPSGFVITERTRACVSSGAGDVTVPVAIGYVRVSGFAGRDAEAAAFANGIQGAIMAADREELAGWLVDLRGNRGGNMWPMVAGLGPLLGDGVFGYFIDPTGMENVLEYRDGASWDNGVIQQRVDAPYRLRRLPRVAVLTDNATASSGEATAIAFRGRPNTRSFGISTCGLSTAVENYPMSDGATLNLAISVMADRTRTKYGANVSPDEVLPDPQHTVARAVQWLQAGS